MKIRSMAKFGLWVPAILFTTAFSAAAADFAGKTITIIVPSGSGGTFHVYGQLVQQHIGKHIPGNPTAIVQNRPGAGGAKAAAYMANAAPKDGTSIAEISPGTLTGTFLKNYKFDATKFEFIGSPAARTYTFAVWHTAPFKTFADLTKQEATFGNTGTGSAGYVMPLFANGVLGTKFKVISGYKGGGAINLAIERGEVQGRANYYSGYTGVRPEWISQKKIRFLTVLGPRHPALADVPHIRDLIKDAEGKAMYDFLDADFSVGQAFYLPPGTPKDIVATMRTAFGKLIKDPAFLADAKKRRVPVTPRTHQEIAQLVKTVATTPKARIDKIAKLVGFKK